MADSSHNVRSSQELLSAARQGDGESFWNLADMLRPYLKALVGKLVDHRLAAKLDPSDVVQQGLLRAVERFAEFHGEDVEQFQAWLVAIVTNEARQTVRFWRRGRRDVGREQLLQGGSDQEPPGAADQSTPSQQVSRRERVARLLAAVERLPDEHRQIVALRHFEGLSHAQIAERLGRTEAAVRQLWGRTLRRLRAQLEAES